MSTLTNLDIEMIENLLEGYDVKIHRQYSGRGMMGKSCFGISTSESNGLWHIATVLNQSVVLPSGNGLSDFFYNPPNSDSLGLDKIFYWPSIKVKEVEEEEEEEEDEEEDEDPRDARISTAKSLGMEEEEGC